MALDTSQLKRRASQFAGDFTMGQKAVVGVAVIAVVAGLFTFSQWASKPNMVPLFSNLEAADASAITGKLNSSGIKYELTDNGSTILVPQDKVYQSRLDMSADGLPTGGSAGYALLDKQGITASEFSQRINYQRAVEGELAKTIGAIDGVSASTVHLVMPTDDVFSEDARKPSASVLVKTQPGKDLDGGQVRAIVNLVSSSVEGMTPNEVTLADAKGRVLSAPGEEGSLAAAGDYRTNQTKAFENQRSQEIQAMLDRVLGPGKAVVRVNADLDFDQKTITEQTYGDGQAAGQSPTLSEQTSTEQFTGGAGSNPSGVLGTTDGSTATAASGDGTYQKEDAKRDLGVNVTNTVTKAVPGTVKKLSVAVLVDSGARGANKATLKKQVTAAAGIDAARGDTVAVDTLPFDKTAATEAEKSLKAAESAKKQEGMIGLARTLGTVILVAVVLLLVLKSARKKVAAAAVATPISARELAAARRVSSVDLTGDQYTLDDVAEAKPLPISAEAKERLEIDNQIGDLIERQPEEVAQLLRSWLADRRG